MNAMLSDSEKAMIKNRYLINSGALYDILSGERPFLRTDALPRRSQTAGRPGVAT
jgi:hypothetical protein